MTDTTNKTGRPTVEQVTAHAKAYPVFIDGPGDIAGWWKCMDALGWPCFVLMAPEEYPASANTLDVSRCTDWTPCDQQGNPLGLLERVQELETLHCTCDEESGRHEDTCDVMLHVALDGATEYAREMERERDAAIARAEQAEANIDVMESGRSMLLSQATAATKRAEQAEAVVERTEHERARMRDELARVTARAEQAESANEKHTERIRAMEERLGGLESELATVKAEREEWEDSYHSAASERDDAQAELARVERLLDEANAGDLPEVVVSLQEALHREADARNDADRECERLATQVTALHEWVVRLEDEVNDQLGAPDSPEGKALRALVRRAGKALDAVAMDVSSDVLATTAASALHVADYALAGACVAVLLARREEEPTTLGAALDASWAAHKEAPDAGELECPCCGDVAAEGAMHDGDALLCGCAGMVSLDCETPPYVVLSDDPCPPGARCHRDAKPAKVETCGKCRFCRWACEHPKYTGSTSLSMADDPPPDDCPGPEPREEEQR